jgi:N-succinyldiaminopimelate aminotransferase
MTHPAVSSRLRGFGTTIFSEMTRLANEHHAINLAQGFPDFDGPEFAKEAAIAAIREGHGQYARVTGLPELHKKLSMKYRHDWGLDYAADTEITVTSGATEAIFDAIQGVCDAGDEVILFEPFYDSYKASVAMAGAVPKYVTLHAPDWKFDERELEAAFTRKTRAIVLNTPHNPTGKVYSRKELESIAALCIDRDAICITDEVYEHLVYEGSHVPMAAILGMRDRTITISSFGKTFSLTGWKIGWAAAPPRLTAAVRAAHQFVTFATATPLQHAAAAALDAPRSYYEELRESYRAKRDYLSTELARLGFDVMRPDGTYFCCAGFSKLHPGDDAAFCKWLTTEIGVAALPPSSFYGKSEEGKTYARFAFCKKDETLREGIARLRRALAPSRTFAEDDTAARSERDDTATFHSRPKEESGG